MGIKWVSPDTPSHHPDVELSNIEHGPIVGLLKYTNLAFEDGDDMIKVQHDPDSKSSWIQKPPLIPDDRLVEIAEDIEQQLSSNFSLGTSHGLFWRLHFG